MTEPKKVTARKFKDEKNVVLFPKFPRKRLTKHQEQINEMAINYERVSQSLDVIIESLVFNLRAQGVELNESPKCVKEFTLCVESIKSILFSSKNMEYPLQVVASNLFVTNNGIVRLNSSAAIKRLMSKKKVVDKST